MRNKVVFLLGVLALVFIGNSLSAKASVILKGSDEVESLKNSTLVVVLLEENAKYEDKLNKQHKQAEVLAYQKAIRTYNENIQVVAEKCLTVSKDITYKTMGEIAGLSASSRAGYSFLVYDRSPQFTGGTGAPFAFDFYSDKQDVLQAMADNYGALIQFDCADPRYHGEEDYRKLDIIVKGKKKGGEQLFEEGLDEIIPDKGSLTLCLESIQNQFDNAEAGDKKLSKDAAKQLVREQVAMARTKALLVCQDNLDRGITEAKIKVNYLYKLKLVSRDDFDKAIINRDTSCCLLVVYPADKVQGGYKPTVNYQHLVVFAGTGEVLVTVVSDVPAGGGMAGSYQKISDKHFKDLVKAEDEITK